MGLPCSLWLLDHGCCHAGSSRHDDADSDTATICDFERDLTLKEDMICIDSQCDDAERVRRHLI